MSDEQEILVKRNDRDISIKLSDIRNTERKALRSTIASLTEMVRLYRIVNNTYEALEEDLLSEIASLTEQRDRWAKALMGLTPGGSEFVGDPERCVKHIAAMRRSEHALHIQARIRLARYEAVVEAARAMKERSGVSYYDSPYEHALDDAIEALDSTDDSRSALQGEK